MRPLQRIYLFLLLFSHTLTLSAQSILLPDIGDSAATLMTPEQERRTGLAVIRNIRLVVDDHFAILLGQLTTIIKRYNRFTILLRQLTAII